MKNVFAYRVFDLRDRFDMPFPSTHAALRALYSDRAYMPEESGEIVAYCSDGSQIVVPTEFFIQHKPRFNDREEAIKWLLDRQAIIAHNSSIGSAMGMLIANPKDPFDKQLNDALAFKVVSLNREQSLEKIASEIECWIEQQIASDH
jgi:hypothetical protein